MTISFLERHMVKTCTHISDDEVDLELVQYTEICDCSDCIDVSDNSELLNA